MKVNLVLQPANRSWIIQKIAERLNEELHKLGVDASITDQPDSTADLVHHMSWAFANIRLPQPSTMFITHLDDHFKLDQVRAMLIKDVRVGICMSSDTMRQLVAYGCAESSVYYISPAHDALITPRRIVIGITSRVYPDGRKRELLLQQVARRMDLSPFEFRIFGLGWEPTIDALKAAGAKVAYFSGTDDFRRDYATLMESVPSFDHYLYLGLDEGSLGILDALAAGISTIVTPQGFHIDLPQGITHPVLTADDVERVLQQLASPSLARRAAVANLTWATYAQRHLSLWRTILDNQVLPALPQINVGCVNEYTAAQESMRLIARANTFSVARLVSSISHWPFLRSVRQSIDKVRLK
jgi:hypothetical protein